MNPPPIPPHSDLSGIGHLQRLPSTPERTHINHLMKTPVRRDLPPIPIGQKSFEPSNEINQKLDSKEEMRQRELEEVRARVAQMEKTMRWWSDCTANWREKWSKVRNERNQAREENRGFKNKFDLLAAENNELKKRLKEIEYDYKRISNAEVKTDTKTFPSEIDSQDARLNANEEKENLQELQETDLPANQIKKAFEEAKEKLVKESKEKQKLEDTLKMLQKKHDKLNDQYNEVVKMKLDSDEEICRLQEWKKERLEAMKSDIEEGMMSDNEQINPRLLDLHKELEHLQLENANEWALREKLETDKLSLERENKRLKADLNLVSEELSKIRLVGSCNLNKTDVSNLLQEEINEKSKEINELKQMHSKYKKQLQEKTSELEHLRSRSEHYEMEVKKLRSKVEQLKRDLADAEDESDQQSITVKKLQRHNEELEQKLSKSHNRSIEEKKTQVEEAI